jgi:hypothetical protein
MLIYFESSSRFIINLAIAMVTNKDFIITNNMVIKFLIIDKEFSTVATTDTTLAIAFIHTILVKSRGKFKFDHKNYLDFKPVSFGKVANLNLRYFHLQVILLHFYLIISFRNFIFLFL